MTRRNTVQVFVGFDLSCDLLGFSSANFNSSILMFSRLMLGITYAIREMSPYSRSLHNHAVEFPP